MTECRPLTASQKGAAASPGNP